MSMRIAVVSHVRHPVAEPFMGGLEAHSFHLCRALEARGHEVTLFASGDSDPRFRIEPVLPVHYDRDFPWHHHHGTEALNRHVDAGFSRAMRTVLDGDFDVVHNNSVHRYPPRLARQHRVPMLTSLHVPPFDALRRAVHSADAPWSRFAVTSEKQLGSWWPEGAPEAAHVAHNGIDLDAWEFRPEGDGRAVWAGRILPNKGLHFAVTAAQFANMPLDIFGVVEDEQYFNALIRPYLSKTIRYHGHVDAKTLARAVGGASVFVFTPLWDEPFGLAAVEAMACGVPVAAIDNGAVREIVGADAGRFARPNEPAALGIAMKKAARIDRAVPRARVEACYSLDRMVDRYEALYAECIAGLEREAPEVDFPRIELNVAPAVVPIAAE
ncbi:glycosyltransferase [Jannaschia sp. W003]|uniref:glycosyltransferase n=1 Tax=Jannaschia sp. W003 TaxID=2867012 RepID=UPI0021A83955|nr:glycosyltransferase [Jannaschia sp. W003]UWQ21319.1 glycosyltransferase [Jannaschia sp. W003]